MTDLWRGTVATRARIISGLVLFTYALLHFLNTGMALVSPLALDPLQDARQWLTRSYLGTLLLYGSLITHAGLALARLATRRTLRLPAMELAQIGMGFLIPFLLATHIVFTRVAHEILSIDDSYVYLVSRIWGQWSGWRQGLLLMIVWVHGCIGIHMWLRSRGWWQSWLPAAAGCAVFVPVFAIAGFVAEGRRVAATLEDPDTPVSFLQALKGPTGADLEMLVNIIATTETILWLALASAATVYIWRRLVVGHNKVRIRYINGPEIVAPKGMTLLEASRTHGVPHTSLCGGRGRCTTCRVVIEQGAELLPPPYPAEQRSLNAVKAPSNTRLACQVRPTDPVTVFRVFRSDGRGTREHSGQGREKRLALMFLDMRGFTERTTDQLPYDVVFLLNRFFDAIVPAITSSGGKVDKYLGDGLLAVFDARDEKRSARAALNAAAGVGAALKTFNQTLAVEQEPEVRIGMSLHLGDIVLGEIGAVGTAQNTIIGDAVNTASRLETKTKERGVDLLVSQSVLAAASATYDTAKLESFDLRGVALPIQALPVQHLSGFRSVLDSSE